MTYTSILSSQTQEEITIKETKIYIEGCCIFIIAKGNLDDLDALKTKEAVLTFMAQTPSQVNLAIDLSDIGAQSIGAKTTWTSLNEMSQTKRTVLICRPTNFQLITNILNVFSRKKMVLFKSKSNALLWLSKN